jgi:hypothetical protein
VNDWGKSVGKAWTEGFVKGMTSEAAPARAAANTVAADAVAHAVARAYHYRGTGTDACVSCSKPWPCPTFVEYGE